MAKRTAKTGDAERLPWRVNGKRMQEARAKAALTQFEVAVQSGVSPRFVSALETGDAKGVSIDTLGPVCEVLGITLDWACGPRPK